MTRTFESTLAEHGVRITQCEHRENYIQKRLDWLIGLLVITLLTTCGTLLSQIVQGVKR
jgi:hypothetical protein